MNLSSNVSMVPEESKERRTIPKDHSLVVSTVCGLIATFSFIGNLLLCVVILKRRSMLTKPYNVLIFNLAVTDMLTGEFCFSHPFFLNLDAIFLFECAKKLQITAQTVTSAKKAL